ncbi:transcription factor bHLH90 isoform X2 [Tripterygium wilfordii]|uniref:transcription factor bHLH90 isoform X2 n=1 Tax=Tripterygium wilfordii TaxID=458696 RepID=UPI0018F823FC|nr:transcription factor bHLH90 isoform X2 [Tripterygium wilfordii]
MRGLERAVEWLRPFVDPSAWDYIVVWKLGDDPSRFIEWVGCCCGGVCVNVKEEKKEEEQHLVPLCRDAYIQHPIRTRACEALAHFPSFMSLYSGIHGEVVISAQTRWLNFADASDTQPANIPEDHKTIELITTQCDGFLEKEAAGLQSDTGLSFRHQLDLLREEALKNFTPLHLFSFIPNIQFPTPSNQSSIPLSLEGSWSSSNASYKHPSLDLDSDYFSSDQPLKQSTGKSYGTRKRKYGGNLLKQQSKLIPNVSDKVAKDKAQLTKRPERDDYQSKNLVTERKRRRRIQEGLFTLRSLVPNISKMDKTAILGDAIEYIKELQKEVKKLEEELRETEDEEYCQKDSSHLKTLELDGVPEVTRCLPPTEHSQRSSGISEQKKMEVRVEVNQIGRRDFLIKLLWEHKRGGFRKLMETIYSLGLQVVDINITTFNGNVLNILRVEACKGIQSKKLQDTLIKLTDHQI